jgi:transformation/transcription domain-associated protein
MTPIGMEGLFVCSIATIADSLSSPDNDLHDFLSLFVRDELMAWQNVVRKSANTNTARIRDLVNQNVRLILTRAQTLSCKAERDHATEKLEPLFQTVLDLVSQATNPLKLAQMDISYLPQL